LNITVVSFLDLNHEDIGIIERMHQGVGVPAEGFDGGVLSPYEHFI
jgi:hypothetical protein